MFAHKEDESMKTRQTILKATERIIQSKGLARVTTKEIAREAGCAEGTLYKHFADKESLFLAAIQENLPAFAGAIEEAHLGEGDIGTTLRSIALAALSFYEKLLPLSVSLFADTDLLAQHRAWMQDQRAGPQHLCERVAAYIEVEQQRGRINQHLKAIDIAVLLLGPCFQQVFFRYFLGEAPVACADLHYVEGMVESLLAGISPQ